jgi:hemerythrin
VKIDRSLIHTGIPLIDRQHEGYADLVDRVFALCSATRVSRGNLEAPVNQALAYALEHFDSEEQLMRTEKYPVYDEHVARHNFFREQADQFAAELAAEPLAEDFTVRLARLLLTWFCGHVQTEDLRLAVFLKKAGRKTAS